MLEKLYQTFDFRRIKPELKTKAFFNHSAQKSQILYLYRVQQDIKESKDLIFFDEYGIDQYNQPSKILIHRSEDKYRKRRKTYTKINVILISSLTKILYYEIFTDTVDSIVINGFLKRFTSVFNKDWYKSKVMISDNASIYVKYDMETILRNFIARVIFICPEKPQLYMVEFVINEIKRKTILIKDIEK